jgi:cysteine desulfuration protein SufE
MEESFKKNCEEIKNKFANLTLEERHNLLIDWGRKLPLFPDSLKTAPNLVSGCQSTLYIASEFKDGKVFFQATADALISAGLAALLIKAYSGLTPETILKSPPTFLTDLNLSLSPNRSNGLAHIHLRIQQEALRYLLKKKF